MDEIWSFLGGLLGAITFVLAIANRVGDRFMRIELNIQELKGKLEVQQEINRDLRETLTYYQNSSVEQLKHVRSRLEEKDKEIDGNLRELFDSLDNSLSDIQGYLTRATDFEPRRCNVRS